MAGEEDIFNQRRAGRHVRIKHLHHHLAASAELCAHVTDLAEEFGRVDHPGWMSLDCEHTPNGNPVLITERVRGLAVRDVLDGEQWPLEAICVVGIEVAAALSAAHRLEPPVIHRAIADHVVWLTRSGTMKIADNIAARTRSLLSPIEVQTIGIEYMSPEQAAGEEIGPSTDVFSLGLILWRLTAGRSAFDVSSGIGNVAAAIRAVDIPRLRDYRPQVPWQLEDALAQALRRDPADRLTAAELESAMRHLLLNIGGEAYGRRFIAGLAGGLPPVRPRLRERFAAWIRRVFGRGRGRVPTARVKRP